MAQYDIIFKVNANASGELFTERKLKLSKGQLLLGTDSYPEKIGPYANGQMMMWDSVGGDSGTGIAQSGVFQVDFDNEKSALINAFEIDPNIPQAGKPFRVRLTQSVDDPYDLIYYTPSYTDAGLEGKLGLRLNSSRSLDPRAFYDFQMDILSGTIRLGTGNPDVENGIETGVWLAKKPDRNAWLFKNSLDEHVLSFENQYLSVPLDIYAGDISPRGLGLLNDNNPADGSVLFGRSKIWVKKSSGAGDWNSIPVPDMNGEFDLNNIACQMDIASSTSPILKTWASRLWVVGGNNEDNLVAIFRNKGSELVAKDTIGSYCFVPKNVNTAASAFITAIASANHGASSNPTAMLFGQSKTGETGSTYNNQYRMMIAGDGRVLVKSAGINIQASLPVAASGFDVHDSVGFGPTIESASDITLGNAYCYMMSGADAGRTFTLPLLANCQGRSYFVINATSGQTLTIARSGTDKANGGSPTITLATGDAVFIHATGSSQYGWFISATVKR